MKVVVDIPDNDMQRKEIVKLLAKEDSSVLGVAYLYATHIAKNGIDITEKWFTATQQAAELSRAYNQGRYDILQEIDERRNLLND